MVCPEFLTVQETADALRISIRTVYRWLAAGRLPAVRVGNVTRIRRVDLDAFVHAHLSEAPQPTVDRA